MNEHELYESPLITRYSTKKMSENFGDRKRYSLWRKLWIALAESEKELGLPITDEQIAEMEKYKDDINYETEAEFERAVRHDVMAHVKAFGAQAKSAEKIIGFCLTFSPPHDMILRQSRDSAMREWWNWQTR